MLGDSAYDILDCHDHLLVAGVVPVAPYNPRHTTDPKDIECRVEDRIEEHSEKVQLKQSILDETYNHRTGVERTNDAVKDCGLGHVRARTQVFLALCLRLVVAITNFERGDDLTARSSSYEMVYITGSPVVMSTMTESPSELFITHSPYHSILAYSIASSTNSNSSIFIQPDMPDESMQSLIKLFKKTDQFDNVFLLSSLYTAHGERKNRINHILDNNIEEINEYIKSRSLDEVCVSLDDRDIDQAAVYYTKRSNQDATYSILEDGIGAYRNSFSNWNPHNHPLLHMIRQRVIHGFNYQRNVSVYGDSKYISHIYAIFPTLLRSHFKKFTKEAITPSPVLELGNSEECTEYLKQSGLDIEKLEKLDVLILSPKVDDSGGDSEKALLSEVVSKLHDSELITGIKHHPRQQNAGDIFPETISVPQSIPAELVLVHQRSNIQAVVGGLSTVFLSSKWLMSEIDVVSIDYILSEPSESETIDDELRQTLESFDINFPDTVPEIVEIIR